MEVTGYDGRNFLWVVLDDPVVEVGKNRDEIGLREFDFNFFDKYEEGVVRKGLIYYPYLLMLMNIWPRYWKNQF